MLATERERKLIMVAFELGADKGWQFDDADVDTIVNEVLAEVTPSNDPADDNQTVL